MRLHVDVVVGGDFHGLEGACELAPPAVDPRVDPQTWEVGQGLTGGFQVCGFLFLLFVFLLLV